MHALPAGKKSWRIGGLPGREPVTQVTLSEKVVTPERARKREQPESAFRTRTWF